MKPRWVLLAVLVLGIGAAVVWRNLPASKAPTGASTAKGGARGVPVLTAMVTVRDVPIWLSGLGTVHAFNTVTVRPRVGGTLDTINFTEGQSVKVGDVLAQIDPRPYRSALEQAKARKAQNEAQLANARRDLERIRALVASDAESRRILEQQEATVAQLAAVAQAAEASVADAQLDLDFTTVRAPIAGRTGVRFVDAGNLVTANQATGLVVITQLQPISAIFTLPQQHFPALRRRLQADSSPPIVHAVGDQGVVLAEGKLDLIDNQIDTSTGTVRLKASFANEDFALWPGQFITAPILVDTRLQAVVVPSEVVQAGLDSPFVYLVKADQTVEARAIKPGPSVAGFTIIEAGLTPGERVVSDGQSKLQPGARVSFEDEPKILASGVKPLISGQ
jgi:multidrug efflux system membrane fusion protein